MSKLTIEEELKADMQQFLDGLKKFDVFHDETKMTGSDSYWIVYIDNDEKMKAGRMGPFNTYCELKELRYMKYMGNINEDRSLGELWKSNPPVPMGDM